MVHIKEDAWISRQEDYGWWLQAKATRRSR
jgi:hypothetical protein